MRKALFQFIMVEADRPLRPEGGFASVGKSQAIKAIISSMYLVNCGHEVILMDSLPLYWLMISSNFTSPWPRTLKAISG